MKTLLVTTPIDFSGNRRNLFRVMPLNLMSLAAAAPGFDVEILDTLTLQMSQEQAAAEIRKINPDVVGFTVTTPQVRHCLELAAEYKKTRPDGIVVFGGVHCTVCPGDSMGRHPQVDYEVIGEGDESFPMLLSAFRDKRPVDSIPGLAYRKNGRVAQTPLGERIADLDSLPFPAYDKIPFRLYWDGKSVARPTACYIGSRGCPFECAFCSANKVLGRRFRGFSPRRVVDDLKRLVADYGVRDFQFKDSNIHLQDERTHQICDLMIREGIRAPWNGNCRVDRVNEEVLRHMAAAGCRLLRFGVETTDPAIARWINRGSIYQEQVERAVKTAEQVGIQTLVFLMVGLPGDTPKTFGKSLQAIKRLNPLYLTVTIAVPFPGTKFYDWAKSGGFLLTEDWGKFWMSSPVHETPEFSREEMIQAQRHSIFSFYLGPRNILKRLRRLTKTDLVNFLVFLRFWLLGRRLYVD